MSLDQVKGECAFCGYTYISLDNFSSVCKPTNIVVSSSSCFPHPCSSHNLRHMGPPYASSIPPLNPTPRGQGWVTSAVGDCTTTNDLCVVRRK